MCIKGGVHMDPAFKITAEQAKNAVELYSKVFTFVRILEASEICSIREAVPSEKGGCRYYYGFWNGGHRCVNCICKRALEGRCSKSKLEFSDNEIYEVTAKYVEIDGRPCVIEMIKFMDAADDLTGEKLSAFREKMYTDVLSGAYNRRYYEEQLRNTKVTAGVALIDLDDFRLYNDTYGRAAGDRVISAAAESIKSCIPEGSTLIRYGGDEFLLTVPDTDDKSFEELLGEILKHISEADVHDFSWIHPTASIGGLSVSKEILGNAVQEAVGYAEKAKKLKNTVVTDKNSISPEACDTRPEILIIDDSKMNRDLLSAILGDKYNISEAENGEDGIAQIRQRGTGIALVLLDIVMPVADGFAVLDYMTRNHWTDDIPVIMISSEASETAVRRAYEMGVSDYISRPFDAKVVLRRVNNTIKLYSKQKNLVKLVTEQITDKEKNSRMMIGILSHIVEFRNGESGSHVLHIEKLSEMLMNRLIHKTDKYNDQIQKQQELIPVASALHDIGKIGIDEKILNKPGRLTPEEFEVMKTHSVIGESILKDLSMYSDDPLIKTAVSICRWHHERYDGRGYPDGLKGDEIPISAQIVSLADVYDALTSERVYKKAFTHEKTMDMILGGECGAFNPILIDCLRDIKDDIKREMTAS